MLLTTAAFLPLALPQGLPERDPQIYTWQEPVGAADARDDIVQMIAEPIAPYQDPISYADEVADLILARAASGDLPAGKLCIVPQNISRGGGFVKNGDVFCDRFPALFRALCDGLEHEEDIYETNGPIQCAGRSTLYCEDIDPNSPLHWNWWNTPWMDEGILESGGFMQAFVTQLQARLALTTIGGPTRFHCDSEGRPSLVTSLFDEIQLDSRWNQGLNGYPGQSLATMYSNAGSPAAGSQDWKNWFNAIMRTQSDAAMEGAVYSIVQSVWPNALCSNYGTSWRVDEDKYMVSAGGNHDFLERCEGVGDLQAPVFYKIDPSWIDEPLPDAPVVVASETLFDARMRLDRRNIEALLYSLHPKDDPSEITPWLLNVSQDYDKTSGTVLLTGANLREQISLFRSKGLHELLLWNDDTQSSAYELSRWNAAASAIDQAWQYQLSGSTVLAGSTSQTTESLRFAVRDHFDGEDQMTLLSPGTPVLVQATFSNMLTNETTTEVEVYVEASSPTPSSHLMVGVLNPITATWMWSAPTTLFDVPTRQKFEFDFGGPVSGSLDVRVLPYTSAYAASFEAVVDCVQLVDAD